MALERKSLKAMGLTEEQIDAIIDGHLDTVNGLKDKVKALEEDLKGLPQLKKQLEDAQAGQSDDWRRRHDAVKKQFDDYKAEIAGREEAAKLKSAYKQLLKDEHIDPRRIDVIMRATSFEGKKLDKDGKLENEDALKADIRKDWADFVQTSGQVGANVPTPPVNTGKRMTVEEIDKIEDAGERQRAIAENHELFGF